MDIHSPTRFTVSHLGAGDGAIAQLSQIMMAKCSAPDHQFPLESLSMWVEYFRRGMHPFTWWSCQPCLVITFQGLPFEGSRNDSAYLSPVESK